MPNSNLIGFGLKNISSSLLGCACFEAWSNLNPSKLDMPTFSVDGYY